MKGKRQVPKGTPEFEAVQELLRGRSNAPRLHILIEYVAPQGRIVTEMDGYLIDPDNLADSPLAELPEEEVLETITEMMAEAHKQFIKNYLSRGKGERNERMYATYEPEGIDGLIDLLDKKAKPN